MARFKIIYLLLLTYNAFVASEEAKDRTISLKPPDKLQLQKSIPYKKEESTFLSRLSNWFFPSSDSVPAEGRHNGPQYLPPQPYQSQPGCNPCNKAPWLPIATPVGHKTVINFVPPSSHIEHLRPPPEYGPPKPQYGPPQPQFRPPQPQYGAPEPQYGPPQPQIKPPQPQYGAPEPKYGPPQPQIRPPQPQYGAPEPQYGPPQPQIRPPQPQYGAPEPQYGPPQPQIRPPQPQYGAPQAQYRPQYGPPKPQYGPPASLSMFKPPPVSNYGPPPVFKPKREKSNLIQNLRPPPPVTHLNPVSANFPIGMKPPPLQGSYQSLPPTIPSVNYYLPPPPPPPSDSYGTPITGPNVNYQTRPEYLPPPEQLPLSTNPIPLPNLSQYPVLPIHNPQNFHDNIPQQGANYEVKTNQNVQVVPSVKVADYLASIEHPINVIQSPLVEVSVKNPDSIIEEQSDVRPGGFYEDKPRLSENPIIVDDTHTAASAVNVTFQDNNNHEELNTNYIRGILLEQEANSSFTAPPLDYSRWQPSWGSGAPSSSMVPPPQVPTTWLQPVDSTTKKPKQIQIIIPYVRESKPYTTLLPVYSPPVSTEAIWSKFIDDFNLAESKKVTATAFTAPTTQVYNIRDLLRDTKQYHQQSSENLPFDIISLQNNIDDWTQQAYSKNQNDEEKKTTKQPQFVPSKKIPKEYLTTPSYPETTTFDYVPAGSSKKETTADEDIETNFIGKETTAAPITSTTNQWKAASVTVSPLTQEKVYIVTPQPYDSKASTPVTAWSHPPQISRNVTTNNGPIPKFMIRVDPEDRSSRAKLQHNSGPLTVVYSEWPHLINNLQTTTTQKLPTSKHPLLGLMELASYAPPPNSTVQTISGHSRVVTVVTPAPVTEKNRN